MSKKHSEKKEKNNKPLKTRVHPTRVIAYLVQLGIIIFLFDFLRNHFMMLAFSIVVAAPVLDIIALVFIYRGISVKLTAPERDVSRFNMPK